MREKTIFLANIIIDLGLEINWHKYVEDRRGKSWVLWGDITIEN